LLLTHPIQGKPKIMQPSSKAQPISFYITRDIKNPGVYQLGPGPRLVSLIDLSGRSKGSADQSQVNFAAPLFDRQHIVIPGENPFTTTFDKTQLLNITKPTWNEWGLLTGIGATKPQAIITFREQNGTFVSGRLNARHRNQRRILFTN